MLRVETDVFDADARAVGAGVLAQVGVVLAAFSLDLSPYVYAATPLIGGLVAGALSRNYRDEWLDGMIVGVFGSFVPVVAIGASLLAATDLSLSLRLDLALLVTALGLGVAILAVPALMLGSAMVASATARLTWTIGSRTPSPEVSPESSSGSEGDRDAAGTPRTQRNEQARARSK